MTICEKLIIRTEPREETLVGRNGREILIGRNVPRNVNLPLRQ
jgi:hypothetical protein